ncbi:MAG: class I SAM-dependent methyltransferase, partial [Phycisphaerae bacterium]|nr:class I SAM-dependent methyltransferase [Phycisphaerae bacterium]
IVIPLARRGLCISGLDICTSAVEFARQRCREEGVTAELAVGDVARWSPPQPVDAVVTLIDSFRHLSSADAAAGAMHAFHAGLRPGGLLIIGLDLGKPVIEVDERNCWEMERDGLVVETLVSSLRKPGKTPGTTLIRAVLHVTEPDGREYEIITDEEMRDYTLDSLKHLAATHGPFEPLAAFEFDHLSINNPTAARDPNGNTVVVFRGQ